jgi:pimeloyl-ACP methyl ester carboxylesterase
VLASQQVEVHPGLTHHELFTTTGIVTLLWHGPPDAEGVVLACGGAMGGLLGPADGLYQHLGETLASRGYGTVRVGWRVPNDLGECTIDAAVGVQMAGRQGARRVVVVGHSFGGAVAIRLAVALPTHVVGVVTLATQSAGCEVADQLGDRPLLLLHGDADELLPVAASEMVRFIADTGELVVLGGAGHLLTQAGDQLRARLPDWIDAVLSGANPSWASLEPSPTT